MATHSSVLAWRIPRTGEPGGLPSVGSHRVGQDWSDLEAVMACGILDLSVVKVPSLNHWTAREFWKIIFKMIFSWEEINIPDKILRRILNKLELDNRLFWNQAQQPLRALMTLNQTFLFLKMSVQPPGFPIKWPQSYECVGVSYWISTSPEKEVYASPSVCPLTFEYLLVFCLSDF